MRRPPSAGLAFTPLAMPAATAVAAGLVYEWLGLAVLRHAWLNVDLLWTLALAATGAVLLLGACYWAGAGRKAKAPQRGETPLPR